MHTDLHLSLGSHTASSFWLGLGHYPQASRLYLRRYRLEKAEIQGTVIFSAKLVVGKSDCDCLYVLLGYTGGRKSC